MREEDERDTLPAPSEVDGMPSWFQRAWKQLRSALFIGTVAAGFVVSALSAWRQAFPPTEPATIAEVNASNTALRADIVQVSDSVMRAALSTYTDSLNVVRKQIEDSMAQPVYKAILDLDRRASRIERNQVAAGIAIEEQRQSSASATQQIMERVSDRTSEERILDALDAVMDRMDQIERRLPKDKTTRQRF